MQKFRCDCGNDLFFGSTQCLRCGCEVGYDPAAGIMRRIAPDQGVRRCENGLRHQICNWTVTPELDAGLCAACRLNRIIPDLSRPSNVVLWGRVEAAKRRLLYTLLRLGIGIPSRAEDPRNGLTFEIVSTALNPSVTTGHLNGVITINLEEADDTYRQIHRQLLGENQRTLLRHFRHESAHYLWSRFLSNLDWGDPNRQGFRETFGDEWRDYAEALSAHYQQGPPEGWPLQFVSRYAAAHPWEDWAETWAHYLQMLDGLESCDALGVQAAQLTLPMERLPVQAGWLSTHLLHVPDENDGFLALLQRWICLSSVLNEIADSLGEPPPCPLVISVPIAQKLRLAHHYAVTWGRKQTESAIA